MPARCQILSSIRWQPLLIRGILKNISTGCGFFTADSGKKLIEAIEHSSLKEKCRIIENDSGLHFLLHLQTELSDQCLSEQLKQQGIKMRPLSEYFLTAENSREHYFIINYSSVDLEKIPAACDKIYRLI